MSTNKQPKEEKFPDAMKWLEKALAEKDSNRETLKHVYHEDGQTVASDGYRLHLVWEKRANGYVNGDPGIRYPDYHAVLPVENAPSKVGEFRLYPADFISALKRAIVASEPVRLTLRKSYGNDASTLLVEGKSDDLNVECRLDIQGDVEKVVVYNGEWLLEAVSGFQANIPLTTEVHDHCLLIGTRGIRLAMLMGMESGWGNQYRKHKESSKPAAPKWTELVKAQKNNALLSQMNNREVREVQPGVFAVKADIQEFDAPQIFDAPLFHTDASNRFNEKTAVVKLTAPPLAHTVNFSNVTALTALTATLEDGTILDFTENLAYVNRDGTRIYIGTVSRFDRTSAARNWFRQQTGLSPYRREWQGSAETVRRLIGKLENRPTAVYDKAGRALKTGCLTTLDQRVYKVASIHLQTGQFTDTKGGLHCADAVERIARLHEGLTVKQAQEYPLPLLLMKGRRDLEAVTKIEKVTKGYRPRTEYRIHYGEFGNWQDVSPNTRALTLMEIG